MGLKMLTPSYNGKGSALGVKIDGDKIKMPKHVATEIGLRDKNDRVYFVLGGDDDAKPNRLYIMTKAEATKAANGADIGPGWPAAGDSGKPRYIRDANIIKEAKLQQEPYTLLKDENGHYLEFNPNLKAGVKNTDAADQIKKNREAANNEGGDQPKTEKPKTDKPKTGDKPKA